MTRAKEVTSTTRKKVSAKPGRAAPKPEGQATYRMANLRPERTGLPFVVFISQRGGARHDVRVKVAALRGSDLPRWSLWLSVPQSGW
jgi:hypothetical protein